MNEQTGIDLEALYRADPKAIGDAIRILQRREAAPKLLTTEQLIVPGSATSFAVRNEQGTTIATIPAQWEAYTPTWSASTAPAIGNGTLTGRWRRVGDTVDVWIRLLWGSTTTGGTGAWYFALPVGAGTDKETAGSAQALDTGTARWGLSCVTGAAGTDVYPWTPGTSTAITATAPMTWATGDVLALSIRYEVQ